MDDMNEAAPAETEAAVEEQAPSSSAREALERAFAAELPDEKAPEAREEQDAEPAPADGRARGPDGKFIAAQHAAPEPKADDPAPGANFSEPPTRFSADAKAAWATAPEPIRAEAHRAIRELESGIEQYKQTVEPLKPYIEMAQNAGTTVDQALQRYVNLEQMMAKDPRAGLTEIARNMGMSPQQMAQVLVGQQPGQADPRDQELAQLRQQVQQLSQGYQSVQQTFQQQREAEVFQSIEQFAASNPRFDELSADMAKMLETGFASDLADAYTKADRLNPAAPQPVAAPAPAQTRQPPRSLTGAPSPGSNPTTPRAPSPTARDALKRAFGM